MLSSNTLMRNFNDMIIRADIFFSSSYLPLLKIAPQFAPSLNLYITFKFPPLSPCKEARIGLWHKGWFIKKSVNTYTVVSSLKHFGQMFQNLPMHANYPCKIPTVHDGRDFVDSVNLTFKG